MHSNLILKKSLGQNFLQDHNILRKEAILADVDGRTVIEIGPGDGRLTGKILEHITKKVTVIEKDEKFAQLLKEKFGERIEVIHGDFLETEIKEGEVILGNIPYNISSQIIFKIAKMKFQRAVLMVQKEFAEKMIAKPNEENYGRLSVTSQLAFKIRYIQTVPRHLFIPIPKVDSAIIYLEKNTEISEFQEEIIRLLFQHRNQTASNALKHAKRFSSETISELGEMSKRRVRTLTKEECLEIAETISS